MAQLSFFIGLVAVISLGQLERVAISGQVSFYLHEVLILGWVIITLFRNWQLIKKSSQKLWRKISRLDKILGLVMLGLIGLGWLNGARLNQLSLLPFLYVGRYAVYGAFFVLIAWTKPIEKRWWSKLFGLLNILWLVFGLIQLWWFPDGRDLLYLGWDNHYYRLVGTLFDPAFIGLALVWFWLWLIQQKPTQKWQNWLLKILLFAVTVAIFLTYSRAAYLAWLGGFLAWGTWQMMNKKEGKAVKQAAYLDEGKRNIKSKSRKMWLVAGGIVVLAGLIFWWLPKPAGDSTNLWRSNSIQIRIAEVEKYLTTMEPTQMILGRGLFVPVPYTAYWLPYQGDEVKLTAAFPDNLVIMLWSFLGIGGAVIAIYWLIKLSKYWWKYLGWIIPMWIAWLIDAQFNNAFFQAFMWLDFGILWLALQNQEGK